MDVGTSYNMLPDVTEPLHPQLIVAMVTCTGAGSEIPALSGPHFYWRSSS